MAYDTNSTHPIGSAIVRSNGTNVPAEDLAEQIERVRDITSAASVTSESLPNTFLIRLFDNDGGMTLFAYDSNEAGAHNGTTILADQDGRKFVKVAADFSGAVFSGDVGIGTTSPDQKLHIVGNILTEGNVPGLFFRDSSETDKNLRMIVDGGFVQFGLVDDSFGFIRNPFVFSFEAPTSSLRLAASGNVGIGTTSPARSLDVASGSVRLNGCDIYAEEVTIADDAFATITSPGRFGGFVFVSTNSHSANVQNARSGLTFGDWGNTPNVTSIFAGANFSISNSGAPTGTTGTNGNITLFTGGTSGSFYVENRSGFSYSFQVVVL